MPELPEVETVLRTLEAQIKGLCIEEVVIQYAKTVEGDAQEFVQQLQGQTFQEFMRRGKYLLFVMDSVVLVSHLRMEGRYRLLSHGEKPPRHTHVIFALSDGRDLCYVDSRKFGRMYVTGKDIDLEHFHDLGPEPFADSFTASYVYAEAKKRKTALKTLLLDQGFIAGIGNIYADEILSACGLRPGRSCQRITHRDAEAIVQNTRQILSEAIRQGGTTIHTFSPEEGVTGLFQLSVMVHGKKACGRCGNSVHMRRIGGRSSYYCPVCQK
ncbi:MAG: DNA-formamidopyrimidine glycosylase [Solobacterium sp.]|nr:DNA-formamidopyrimidine glycosylase [Solobacterium sp.]